jgi:putative hydrolase of the HAD superfamily
MILVFDLDDTLYEEITYVKSGFKAVAKFAADHFGISQKKAYDIMARELKKGRGSIFDVMLKTFDHYSKVNVRKCLQVYRKHKPNIRLYDDAVRCFKRVEKIPKYIVTDGNKNVQLNKIKALKIDKKVKGFFITRQYGIDKEKPSPYCFNRICQLKNITPENVIYIGDNPMKDFVGIKPLGFKTIRILRGNYKTLNMEQKFEAHVNIKTLDEITFDLLSNI